MRAFDARLGLCRVALLMLLTLIAGRQAVVYAAQGDPSAKITAPVSGQSLFGVVKITGTASNATMQSYRLESLSQSDAGAQWQPIAGPVTQQVNGAVLGQWDTTKVSDGVYQVRLRVTLRNGTVLEDYARNLTVLNKQPTPLPSLPPPPTVTLTPTIGATSTPLIQQPPTVTPLVIAPPTKSALIVNPPPVSNGTGSSGSSLSTNSGTPDVPSVNAGVVSFGAIQSAICSGIVLTLLAFGAGGAYNIVRGRLRRPVGNNR